jgi:hypothetical protein
VTADHTWLSFMTSSRTRSCRRSAPGGLSRAWAVCEGCAILTIWARTRAGRPLIVALRKVQDSQRDWWIVGARDMNESEHGLFEQWETKAGGNHDLRRTARVGRSAAGG